jgi:hypothetical protein
MTLSIPAAATVRFDLSRGLLSVCGKSDLLAQKNLGMRRLQEIKPKRPFILDSSARLS